jgi:hypothetical protein
MAKESKGVLACLFLIIVVLGVLVGGIATNWTFSFQPTTTVGTTTGVPVGTYTMGCLVYNSLDISTQLQTSGTSTSVAVKVYWYAYRNGWVLLGSGNGANIELTQADGGYIYVVLSPNSTNYVDSAKIASMNSRVVQGGVGYQDVFGNSLHEWTFKFSLFNVPPAASGYPTATFYGYIIQYDASFTTGTAVSTVSTIGTSTVTKYFPWYFAASASKLGVAVKQISLTCNNTFTGNWTLLYMNIPGVGYLPGSSFQAPTPGVNQVYTYTIGTNLQSCVLWTLPINTNNKFDCTTAIQFTCTTGAVGKFTLQITLDTPSETPTVVTQTAVKWYA